jgi:hypothetical protein
MTYNGLVTSNESLNRNTIIKIKYVKNNPTQVYYKDIPNKASSTSIYIFSTLFILVIIGLIVCMYYISNSSSNIAKFAKVTSGVDTVFDVTKMLAKN